MIPLAVLPTAVDTIESISASPSWKARNAILEFLQVEKEHLRDETVFYSKVCVFNNLAAFYSQPEQAARVCAVVAR